MRDETSPTARALLMLELLQASPGISADRLASRLGVSTRAIRRYVEILREADIPVTSVRGPAGGYRLGRGLRLPPLMFNAPEALALVMAVLDGHHDASDPHTPVGSALGKLLRALPESVAAQAKAVRMATAPVRDRGAARPDPETTVALVRASEARRRVDIDYRSEAGYERTIDVEPWAVVVRHGRWYLLCQAMHAGETRAYRIDRVRSVRERPETFAPPDLDPASALEEHLGQGWEHPAEVVIHAPVDQLRWLSKHLGRLEAINEGTTVLRGSTSNPVMYAEQLALIPGDFEVRRGDEVRAAVAALGRRLTAAARLSAG
ncbi:WYL domain-containing protein [Calidifontibacter sp. DB0510]|uniref:WYL domain-containing protein n=1 Tax=Metallococcus carri TaxID=1656884 RepID=A0A967B4H5_9MICO|nr:WYL domain-containing protein [Metallococcus carri]NOP37997.1 WYL domain-containing protein [Calidifontibacter sp. DB2511S]